jgi:hypothetical protein
MVLPRRRQEGKRSAPALRPQVVLGRARVVASDHGRVHDLLERVTASLARLELEHVEQVVLAVEDQLVEPQQHLPAGRKVRLPPRRLRFARAPHGRLDVIAGALGHGGQQLPRDRVHDLHGLVVAARRGDAVGQLHQPVRIDAPRPGRRRLLLRFPGLRSHAHERLLGLSEKDAS